VLVLVVALCLAQGWGRLDTVPVGNGTSADSGCSAGAEMMECCG